LVVEREFDVKKIVSDSSVELKEKYPNAQKYLEEIALNDLQAHLTPSKIIEIAQNLLKKTDFKDDVP